MKKSEINMSEGPLFGNLIRFTVPVILTGILQLLFNAADLVVVGRFCGSNSVAAVGSTSSLINLIINLFIGLGAGVNVVVAQSLGAKDYIGVTRTVHTAVPVALIGGAFLTVVGVGFSRTFLSWMSTPDNIIDLATVYMQIYFGGIIFTLLYNFCAAILRAAGDTKSPLLYLTLSGVVNVVLNVIFVTVIDMNVAGVALATTISQALSALLVLRALLRWKDECKLMLRHMRIYKNTLARILRIGLPTGLQSCLFSISNVTIQASINSFGSIAVSGNAAGVNIEQFVWTTVNGFHQTAMTFVGHNYGAQKYGRIKKILGICMASAFVTAIAVTGLACVFARPLLSIYITDSAQAINYGVLRILCILPGYCLAGVMDVLTGTIRGLGRSFVSMLISIIGVCLIRVGWVYTIFQVPAFHTLECLYVSYPVSWALTALGQLIAFFVIYNRIQRRHQALQNQTT